MIFNEVYNTYYITVANIINRILNNDIKREDILKLVKEKAFSESFFQIKNNIDEEKWYIIKDDLTTPIKHPIQFYMTINEKRWLKSILLDKRINLFFSNKKDIQDILLALEDIKPLYDEDVFVYFDRKKNGDDYTDPKYIKVFRIILDAVKDKKKIYIKTKNKKGNEMDISIYPIKIEYSLKDDKFRIIGVNGYTEFIFNISKITLCKKLDDPINDDIKRRIRARKIIFTLKDQRKALERAMLHFSDFKKITEKIGEDEYKIQLFYEKSDETEVVIRILAFGPMIKVIEPDSFVSLLKERLKKQMLLDKIIN